MSKSKAHLNGFLLARRASLLGCTMLAAGISVPALAQSLPPDAPPIRPVIDENRVNLTSATVVVPINGLSIGDGDGKLVYQPSSGTYSRHNYNYYMNVSSPHATLALAGRSRTFTNITGVWYSDQGDGSTLTASSNGYTYQGADGTIIEFVELDPNLDTLYAETITAPDGRVTTITYKVDTNYNGGAFEIARVQSVNNNYGYQIKFTYENSSAVYLDEYLNVTNVTMINNAVEYCDPSADSCSLTGDWPSLAYSESAPDSYGSITREETNALSQVTDYKYDNQGRLTEIDFDNGNGRDIHYFYDSGDVEVRYKDASGNTIQETKYEKSTFGLGSQMILQMIARDSSSTEFKRTQADQDTQFLLKYYNGLSKITYYTPDSKGRVSEIEFPEGDVFEYTYDARGNITEFRKVSKTSGTPADIVITAGYDTTCSNLFTCNKPNSVTDPLGNVTDFTYDSSTGQVLTITAPAPSSGATRPKTIFTYADHNAWFKNSSGILVQSSAVSKLTATSKCLTGTSCSGTADEQKTVNEYQTGSVSQASNIQLTSSSLEAGNGTLGAGTVSETTFAYDDVGNLVSSDGPLSGSGDTTAFKYDALRRKVGVIGPDPDGGGSLPNMASKTVYDGRGRVEKVLTGTTAGQTDTAFSNMTVATGIERTYDNANRLLTEAQLEDPLGTPNVYSKTQYSYDLRGRLECAAVRLNPSVYSSLPSSACTLGTGGSYGKDRIAKNVYDNDDRIIETHQAYGTSTVAIEKKSYTDNGKVAYVIDANNNRTTYEYDGHDRLVKTRYPVATLGSNSSSTTDYEELTYDAASNVTNVRLRDGNNIAFTFDNLNRTKTRTPTSEATVTFAYNLLGLETSRTRTDGVNIANSYDALGRITSQTQPYGSASYLYDAAGNATRLTWSDGHYVEYDHDALGRVTNIRENGATSGIGVLASYTYTSLGQRDTVTYGNGNSREYAWDGANRLKGLHIDLNGTTSDLTIGDLSTSTPITYNPASQITSIRRSNDAYAFAGRYNVNRNYTVNGLNQYTAAGAISIGYDARGNLTSSGSDSYTYSKLNEFTSGPNSSTLLYDPMGRLVKFTSGSETRFTYSGPNFIDERNSSNTILRRYVPGPATDEIVVWYEGAGTSDRRWLHGDERGSVVAISDAAGDIIQINTYDEFGIPGSSNIGRFQYTGQTWFAEIGLYNYKARMYSPTLGRFMQTDPIGYADGLNWYNYAGGDPVNGKDPTGNGTEACFDSLCGGNGYGIVTNDSDYWVEIPSAEHAFRLRRHSYYLGGLGPAAWGDPDWEPQNLDPPCISLSEGPVLLQGGGGDITFATGGGVSSYKFKIPSTGAEGTVASGSWLFGLGGSLSGDALSVDTFGQLLGDGYRAEVSVGNISGHVTFDAQGNWSGGGLSFGAGGGIVGGLTKTTLKSSNRPICEAS